MRYVLFNFILFSSLLLINLMAAYGIAHLLITHIQDHPIIKYIWQIGIYLLFYLYFKLFQNRMAISNEPYLILKANFFALITIFSIIFLLKESESYSRMYVLVFFILNGIMPVLVFIIRRYAMKLPWLKEEILVVCDQEGYKNIEQWFNKNNIFGYEVIEYVLVSNEEEHNRDKLIHTLEKYELQTAVVAIEQLSIEETFSYMELLQHYVNRVIILPKMTTIPLINAEVITMIHHRGLVFSTRNNLLSPVDKIFKMLFDMFTTVLLVVLFAPLLFILYMVVFFATKGNPVFKHVRIGEGGKAFNVYKFRTMHSNAEALLEVLLQDNESIREEWERDHKLKEDPRVTKIGHFLRKTSLDELPQLINVMRGEMSLVGPRPITEEEVKRYGDCFHYFMAVKPGITGLWQISGRSDIDYNERVEMDTWYVKNWSIEQDLIILLKTVFVVLSKKGSY